METTDNEAAPISMNDWESALMDQAVTQSAEGQPSQPVAEEDPWALAMAEQSATESVAPAPAPAPAQSNRSGFGSNGLADLFENFDRSEEVAPIQTRNGLEFIMDIPVTVTVELGRTRIAVKNLLQLAQGSVVELEGLAGEPLDVLANGTLIAQGEVVVVNDKFGIRLTDVVTPMERMKRLRK